MQIAIVKVERIAATGGSAWGSAGISGI